MNYHTSHLRRDNGQTVIVEARFVPMWPVGNARDRLDVRMVSHPDPALREWGSLDRFDFSRAERDRLYAMWGMFWTTP